MTRLLAAALLACVCAAPLAAQGVRATPEVLAVEVARNAAHENWQAVADLTDPIALSRLHATFGRVLQLDPDPATLQGFGVRDVAGYMALDPEAVMIALLQLGTAGGAFDVEWVGTNLLGVVREAPDQAHAVVRQEIRFEGRLVSTAEIISMRRSDDGWWAQLGPQLEGMLAGIESQLPTIVE